MLTLFTARHVHVLKLLGDVFEPRHIDRSNVAMLAGAEEQMAPYVHWPDSRDAMEGKQTERNSRWMVAYI